MLYENTKDRVRQKEVEKIVAQFLSSFPITGTGLDNKSYFTMKETNRSLALGHDVDIFHHGRYVAVAEIKCRTGKYNLDYMKKKGWLVEKSLMVYLWREHHKLGRHAMIVNQTSDGYVYYTMLTTLMGIADSLDEVSGMCKSDHGKRDRDAISFVVPFDVMKEMVV